MCRVLVLSCCSLCSHVPLLIDSAKQKLKKRKDKCKAEAKDSEKGEEGVQLYVLYWEMVGCCVGYCGCNVNSSLTHQTMDMRTQMMMMTVLNSRMLKWSEIS